MRKEGDFCTLQLLLVEVDLEASLETVRIIHKSNFTTFLHYPM